LSGSDLPWDIANVAEKITSAGYRRILITARGTMFGYNNLVVDFRSFMILRKIGYPVIFNVTHSVQLPGGVGASTRGQREYAGRLSRTAAAAGVDGIFMEVHSNLDEALCDGPNSLKLDTIYGLLSQINLIHTIANGCCKPVGNGKNGSISSWLFPRRRLEKVVLEGQQAR
jgi:2-dehydro-3-deoxyphosphooctonate aldolase (KDO 8-P synthase)